MAASKASAGVLAPGQIVDEVETILGTRLVDPGWQIESLLEIDIGDVIATDGSGQGQRATPNVEAANLRDLTGLGYELPRDVLKVVEFVRQSPELVWTGLRAAHACLTMPT
jgi:hypothetical protein